MKPADLWPDDDLQRSRRRPVHSTEFYLQLHSGLFIPTWIVFLIRWRNDDLFLLEKHINKVYADEMNRE